MKQIIADDTVFYTTINISDDITTLEYLKSLRNGKAFALEQISHDRFEQLKRVDKTLYIDSRNYVAGYAPLRINDTWRSSSGLKISDPSKNIYGSFVIVDDSIIYEALEPFYQERDAYRYIYGKHFYTEMSMLELLKEEIEYRKKYLIYLGEKSENHQSVSQLEEVSKDELLECATNPEKGQLIYKKITLKNKY